MFAFCLAAALAADQTVRDSTPKSDDAAVIDGFEEAERRITERTVAFRSDEGRRSLATNEDGLLASAEEFAAYMARTGRYGHTADGRTPAQRAEAAGYAYCTVRENIAWFESSADVTADDLVETFFTGWKESPGHRKNMLSRDVGETAVAIAQSEATGRYFAVQLFGRPASERMTVVVANESGEVVRYQFAGETWDLPARVIRTHEVCQETELRLLKADDKLGPAIEIEDGSRFVIGDGPKIVRKSE